MWGKAEASLRDKSNDYHVELFDLEACPPGNRSARQGQRGYAWWSWLALVFLGAALLKADRGTGEPIPGFSSADSRLIWIALIWLEVLLGCWLLTGLHRRATRWVVVAVFTLFAAVALNLALRGAASCGCFGSILIHPFATFAFDITIAASVMLIPPPRTPSLSVSCHPKRLVAAAAGAVLLGSLLTALSGASRTSALATQDDVLGDGVIVALDPGIWIGKTFPLRPHIRLDSPSAVDLSEGNWLVVLYHHDCARCQAVDPAIRSWALNQAGVRVAFVEMPPYAAAGNRVPMRPHGDGPVFVSGRLDEAREWFAQTPVLIYLRDGVVVEGPRNSAIGEGHP